MSLEEKIRAQLSYDPDSGLITRLVTRGNKSAGSVAGYFDDRGYQRIDLEGHKLLGHRVAFLFMTGSFPDLWVDHINGNPRDNRWTNLRLCTASQNAWNRVAPVKSGSGVRGVMYATRGSKKRPWEAVIWVNSKVIYLGRFATKGEAIAARYAASEKYHGEFAGCIDPSKPIVFKEPSHD